VIKPELIERFRVEPGKKLRLKDHDSGWAHTAELKEAGKAAVKKRALEILQQNRDELSAAQELLWASDADSVLIVLQAMDAAGKDGTIKHVMSGLNPQGCQVFSFKKPSDEELKHNFLYRYSKCLPARGMIGIFNRSYYEEVLVVRVHPELLANQQYDPAECGKSFWKCRYEDINAYERHLTRNRTVILKFFLHISKSEQKRRFLERINNPDKHWKFSNADIVERGFWNDYMRAFEKALSATSTEWAPWYVIPADHKWVARALVSDILASTIGSLGLKFPEVSDQRREQIAAAKEKLLHEDG
jgi:PPK2 family polyphosphate:nucleotide phosphotransferase